MASNSIDHNRMLLEIDRTIRELNRTIINPQIPELKMDDLKPVLELVARARASYLKELFDMASVVGNGLPSPDQIKQLKQLRLTYEELVQGAQALETAIQRCYLDITS